MATASPPDDNDNDQPQPNTRLDREIREILQRSPLPSNPKPSRKPPQVPGGLSTSLINEWTRKALGNPLLLAFGLGLLAWLTSDVFRPLALVLAIGAVVALILPWVRPRQSGIAPGERKMWRGQYIEVQPIRRSPMDAIREWWRNRTR